MNKTVLIRINPASNGFSVVLTNHNIPGAENRKEVVKSDFQEVQSAITEFLTEVAATDAAQEAAKTEKEAAKAKAAETPAGD